MDEVAAEKVLVAVEQVPPGRVVAYGDIAELVGIGPRQVGAVMRIYGWEVPWWRVVNSSGNFPAELLAAARPHWRAERIKTKANGKGCRISTYRADLAALATAYDAAIDARPDLDVTD